MSEGEKREDTGRAVQNSGDKVLRLAAHGKNCPRFLSPGCVDRHSRFVPPGREKKGAGQGRRRGPMGRSSLEDMSGHFSFSSYSKLIIFDIPNARENAAHHRNMYRLDR
jgi:hypothetical protein